MGDTIQIDVAKLTSAITKLTTLVDSIDSRRRAAATSPIGLPSLGDTQLGVKVARMRDRLPELQTRLDLAKLLDEKGTGQVTYYVTGPDDLLWTKQLLGVELAHRLKALKVDDPASRLHAAELIPLLAKYGKDGTVAKTMMLVVGADGLTKAMRDLRSITATQPPYWVGVKDPAGERKAVLALQDQMAGTLALLLSTASKSLGREWAETFAHDPWATGVLLRYADKQNLSFGREFFRGVGHALKEREQGNPLAWDGIARDIDNTTFGTESFTDSNPMREYLNTADNSTETSQAVMGDKDLLEYFLRDRRYQIEDPLLDQAGKVLDRATIGAARSLNDEEAKSAADISSHVLWMTNDKTKPNAGFTDEVGSILATYVMDVDRVLAGDGSDDPNAGPGATTISKYRVGLGPDDGLPRFRIALTDEVAKKAIAFIRDDDDAVSKFGQAVTQYNQVRMDWGATHREDDQPGDLFHTTVNESAQLASVVTAELIEGDLDNVEKRIKAAERLTAPLDNLNSVLTIGKVPLGELINDGIIGNARDAAGDHLLQDALREANEKDGRATAAMKLQATYALVRADPELGGLLEWPRTGPHFIAPSEMTDGEVRLMREAIGNGSRTTAATGTTIENAWKSVEEKYRQR